MDSNETISSGLLELYVLGMANEQETAQVIAMAKQYPEIEAEIVSIERSLKQYAETNAATLSDSIKEKIFAEINKPAKTSAATQVAEAPVKVIPVSLFWKYAAAASIILFIGSAVLSIAYYRKYESVKDELAATNKERSAMEQQLFTQQQENDEMKDKWKLFQSKYSEPVVLRGLPETPNANAKIFWMKNTGEVYIDPGNLPEAPEGMQYQFWGIVDGKPVDGGMIITTKRQDKYRIQKMRSFGKAEAFAVTLETAGGHPSPKGKMYVMGKM